MTHRWALVAVLVASAACGRETVSPTILPATTTTTTTTPTSTVPSSTGPVIPRWPLTGLPRSEPVAGPVLVVKIDNSAAGRPQLGLERADAVFEVVVEGGISRLLALFQMDVPDQVGPVRSVREVDPKLIEPFGALMAHSGGQSHVIDAIAQVAADVGAVRAGEAYFRAGDRPAPYDLILRTADVLGRSAPDPSSDDWFLFGPAPDGGEQALSAEISLSSATTVTWRYASADGGYLRFNGSAQHLAVGGPIVAATVAVLTVAQFDTGRTDSSGSPVPDFRVTGSGAAFVFREGRVYSGTWERGAQDTFFRLFDGTGHPIPFAAGTVWIEFQPFGQPSSWK